MGSGQIGFLYKKIGAQYFFSLGNHHDNYDLWDSQYQEWNSVNIGPKKDILAGWAEAAKKTVFHLVSVFMRIMRGAGMNRLNDTTVMARRQVYPMMDV